MTTINDEQAAALAALPNQKQRVIYACEAMPATAATLPADVMAWLADREIAVPRQTTSKHLNAWKDQHNIPRVSTGSTGTQRAITPGTLAALDARHGFVGTPQENPAAGLEGSHNMKHATVADFAPSASAPTSPAVSTPPESVRPVASPSLPPVVSPPRRVAPLAVEPATRPDASAVVTADASAPAAGDGPAGAPRDMASGPDAGQAPTRRVRFWDRVSGKFIWVQYVLLLQVAAYGLYQVLDDVAGAPTLTAIGGAIGVELVGISLKMLSDRAERDGENYRVVRALLVASGVVALGIGIANGWGHSQMPSVDGSEPMVGAVLFGLASVAGYSMWTIRTGLAHRAERRARGQLEGPGIRIPAYARERYGDAVADRAELLSRYNDTLSVPEYVEQARAELDAEEREASEKARRKALRAVLIAHAKATHKSELAAELESRRFSDDELSDMVSATIEEHVAKRDELVAWLDADKQ